MTHTVQYWCQSFISQLKETASQSQELKCDLDFEKGLKMFSSRKKRLILLDYDVNFPFILFIYFGFIEKVLI